VANAAPTEAEAEEAQPTVAESEEEEPAAEADAPQDLPVNEDDWHVLGSADAEVTIVEYSDFQ
jgi:hypothetical protein